MTKVRFAHLLKIGAGIILIGGLLISNGVIANDLPAPVEPMITNDPRGNMPPAELNDAACHFKGVVESRGYNPDDLPVFFQTLQFTVPETGYSYTYYTYDLIMSCVEQPKGQKVSHNGLGEAYTLNVNPNLEMTLAENGDSVDICVEEVVSGEAYGQCWTLDSIQGFLRQFGFTVYIVKGDAI